MNKQQLLIQLAEILSQIRYHPNVLSELTKILAKSGIEQKFLQLFLTHLTQERELGIDAIKLEEFERIEDGINSMHLAVSSQMNIRILYSYLPDRSLVLLHAFYKRSRKRKTDYQSALPVAKQRLREMKGDISNG